MVKLWVNAMGGSNPGVQPHATWKALAATDIERYGKYRELVEEGVESEKLERIRYCVQKGLPTGSDRFRSVVEDALKRRIGNGRRGRPTPNG